MKNYDLGLNYLRPRPWRWWRWRWGFRIVFLLTSIVLLSLYYSETDEDARNLLLIVFIVVIVVEMLVLILLAYFASRHRRSLINRPFPRASIREVRRARARRVGLLNYCIKCGKEIRANAQFCEFCGANQTD
ncbi:MAG: zinc ribbon domain-containing protein [Candidatus Helarchaeota archaeon]